MVLIRRFLIQAARQVAADPRVQAKAAQVFETEIKPRAAAAWKEAKPRLDQARSDLREIAQESDPREKPREFAAKVKVRFIDREPR